MKDTMEEKKGFTTEEKKVSKKVSKKVIAKKGFSYRKPNFEFKVKEGQEIKNLTLEMEKILKENGVI